MSRNQISGHAQGTHFDYVAIEQRTIDFYGRITWWASSPSCLSLLRRPWNRGRVEHAVLHIRNFSEPGHHRRAGLLFQVGGATRLIPMIVVEQDGLNIGHLEA